MASIVLDDCSADTGIESTIVIRSPLIPMSVFTGADPVPSITLPPRITMSIVNLYSRYKWATSFVASDYDNGHTLIQLTIDLFWEDGFTVIT